MPASPRCPRVRKVWAWALLAVFFALSAEAAAPKRVLLLHSYGRDFAPYDTITSVFRTDLARRASQPVTFIEANLDFWRAGGEKDERALLDLLRVRFDDAPPDVVVTIGPPAARMYARHRAALFPGTPWVMGALDQRFVQQVALAPGDAVVGGRVDLPGLVENILQVLPDTQTIAVVVGASELERTWLGELKREFAPFVGRVMFEWLNELSLAQMQERVAKLPPHSAVLYALLIVDAAGVPHERQDALVAFTPRRTRRSSACTRASSARASSAGRTRRNDCAASALPPRRCVRWAVQFIATATRDRRRRAPVYDWRELERWKIDPARLPTGSEIRFRPPSLWDQHRTAIVATVPC